MFTMAKCQFGKSTRQGIDLKSWMAQRVTADNVVAGPDEAADMYRSLAVDFGSKATASKC